MTDRKPLTITQLRAAAQRLGEGQATDPDTGAGLTASIHGASPSEVAFFECNVEGADIAAVATAFLAYCATVPYDGGQPDEARAWVEANIERVKPGAPAEKSFGGVTLSLVGNLGNAEAADFGLVSLSISALE